MIGDENPMCAMEPLRWPDGFSFRRTFLWDAPFIGSGWKTRRFISKQLEARRAPQMDLWKSIVPGREFLVADVSVIIMKNMNWPNWYFLPKDRCDILFFDPDPFDCFRVIDTMFGLDPKYPQAIELVSNASTGKAVFSELIVSLFGTLDGRGAE